MKTAQFSYDAGVFKELASTDLGRRLWQFLNEPENVVRMETATALGRPAVEALETALLAEFGADVMPDRTKQMIGHMVRQVMEAKGYVLDAQNVKLTSGAPFSRGSRYRDPRDRLFHVFRDSSDARAFALTFDKAGAHLPGPSKRRWLYWKSFQGGLRGRIAFGLEDERAAREAIERDGYYLYRMARLLRA